MKILKRNCDKKQFPSKSKSRDFTIRFGRDCPSGEGSVLRMSPSPWEFAREEEGEPLSFENPCPAFRGRTLCDSS